MLLQMLVCLCSIFYMLYILSLIIDIYLQNPAPPVLLPYYHTQWWHCLPCCIMCIYSVLYSPGGIYRFHCLLLLGFIGEHPQEYIYSTILSPYTNVNIRRFYTLDYIQFFFFLSSANVWKKISPSIISAHTCSSGHSVWTEGKKKICIAAFNSFVFRLAVNMKSYGLTDDSFRWTMLVISFSIISATWTHEGKS